MAEWVRHDALRPVSLNEFCGQPDLVRELRIVLSSAKQSEELPDHLLFAGPPGLGKTTLAHIIAAELGLGLVATSGPAIDKPADLAGLVTSIPLDKPSVLFIDETHRLDRTTEEKLYTVMEDGYFDLSVGEGVKSRAVRIPVAPLVVIGATTQMGSLSSPFRDRFGYTGRLRLYTLDDLSTIVLRSASLLSLSIESDGARAIAVRSRGTPRVANALVRRVRDWARVENLAEVSESDVIDALSAFSIDDLGLDQLGRDILTTLCTKFQGGPVGVGTLAAAVGEAVVTLEEVYEPDFMRQGLLARTQRGRVATQLCYEHLGLPVPAGRFVGVEPDGQATLL